MNRQRLDGEEKVPDSPVSLWVGRSCVLSLGRDQVVAGVGGDTGLSGTSVWVLVVTRAAPALGTGCAVGRWMGRRETWWDRDEGPGG